MGEFANANRQEEGAELNWNSVLNYKTGISGIFAPAEQLQSATKEVRLISLPVSFLQFNNVECAMSSLRAPGGYDRVALGTKI
jgi:hypothetical protein